MAALVGPFSATYLQISAYIAVYLASMDVVPFKAWQAHMTRLFTTHVQKPFIQQVSPIPHLYNCMEACGKVVGSMLKGKYRMWVCFSE